MEEKSIIVAGNKKKRINESSIIIQSDNALIVYDRPRVFYDDKSHRLLEKCKKTLRCVNIFATAKLDTENVDVIAFAKRDISAVFGSKFGSVSHRLRYPKSMFSTYSKRGIVTCMGPKTVESAVLAIHKYIRYLNIQDIDCQLVNIDLNNVVYSVTTFPIDLARMLKMIGSTIVNYVEDKESKMHFPAASIICSLLSFIKIPTRIVFLVFISGKINITGAASEEEALHVFELVFIHILIHVRVCQDNIRYSSTTSLATDVKKNPPKRTVDEMMGQHDVVNIDDNQNDKINALGKDIMSVMNNLQTLFKEENLT